MKHGGELRRSLAIHGSRRQRRRRPHLVCVGGGLSVRRGVGVCRRWHDRLRQRLHAQSMRRYKAVSHPQFVGQRNHRAVGGVPAVQTPPDHTTDEEEDESQRPRRGGVDEKLPTVLPVVSPHRLVSPALISISHMLHSLRSHGTHLSRPWATLGASTSEQLSVSAGSSCSARAM